MNLLTALYRRVRGAGLAALLSLAVLACQGEDDLWTEQPPAETSLLTQLRVPHRLAVAPSAVDATAGSFAAARGEGGGLEAELPLAITGGAIELWSPAEGILFVADLEVTLADVAVPPEVLPPHGVHLTGVSARLARPATLEVEDGGAEVRVVAHLDLEARWSLVVGDTVHNLQTLGLDRVPISLEVERDALGRPQARLVGFRDGAFWTWAGFRLSDLTVDLLALPIEPE